MSKLSSIVRFKCPRCRKGNLFVKQNPYSFKKSLDMHERCPVCGQDFKIEPGFYIGALWTSFPIVILIMTLLSVLLLVYFKMDMNWFFVALTIILLLLQPIIIRLGRSIWIHLFVGFQGNAEDMR
jgi:uncharacterized protein (DUF983 family)